MSDYIRRCILSPYRKGLPKFRITLWHTNRRDWRRQSYLRYELAQLEKGKPARVIFEGDDYSPSPCAAIDSDESVAGIMGFLTLRPGDTDDEYFETYSPAQVEFCEKHAEALSCECCCRFGEV